MHGDPEKLADRRSGPSMTHDKVDLTHVSICIEDDAVDVIDVRDDCEELVGFDHTNKSNPYANVYVDRSELPDPESLPLGYDYGDVDLVTSSENGRNVVVGGEIEKTKQSTRSGTKCLKFKVIPE